jgi:Domain of unknown function (DUF4270)
VLKGFETFYKDGMRNTMRSSFLNIFFAVALLLSYTLFVSCDKVNIPLTGVVQSNGLNLSLLDNYKVSLQTLQVDSFVTSNQQIFMVGYNTDPDFGTIHAGSYAQLYLPGTNPSNPTTVPVNNLLNANISFDSIEVILKPQGNYYGDTLQPVDFKVYELAQALQNVPTVANPNATQIFYNSRSLAVYPGAIGENTVQVFPKRGDSITIRLADTLGLDLLNKIQSGAPEITTQAAFQSYFPGVYIDVDSSNTKTLYNFSAFGGNVVMRIYYKLHGLFSVQYHLDFIYNTTSQFSHINSVHTGTPLAAFTPFQPNELINSAQTGHRAYYNSSTGYFIKISFPDINSIKSLYPYVRVVDAQLIVPPSPGTFNYPYNLPTPLYLFETDDGNTPITAIFGANSGPIQDGNLFIDYYYGISTGYTYDITTYINSLLATGDNPTNSALLLAPTNILGNQSLERLIVNDQTLTKDIQLRLYVLGINTNTTNSSSY